MLASTADCSKFLKLRDKQRAGRSTRPDSGGSRRGEKKLLFKLNSHGRSHLVLEGVRWDPVGAFEENRFPIDAKIEAQAWRADYRLLDQFY